VTLTRTVHAFMLGGYWPREMVSGLEAHTGKNNYGKFRFDAAHTSGAVFQGATTAASTRAQDLRAVRKVFDPERFRFCSPTYGQRACRSSRGSFHRMVTIDS
jgi:hypothetical protein